MVLSDFTQIVFHEMSTQMAGELRIAVARLQADARVKGYDRIRPGNHGDVMERVHCPHHQRAGQYTFISVLYTAIIIVHSKKPNKGNIELLLATVDLGLI